MRPRLTQMQVDHLVRRGTAGDLVDELEDFLTLPGPPLTDEEEKQLRQAKDTLLNYRVRIGKAF